MEVLYNENVENTKTIQENIVARSPLSPCYRMLIWKKLDHRR